MKIIITGASGFVGSKLASRLATNPLSAAQQLILVDRVSMPCPSGAVAVVGDIADPALLADLAGWRPDLVFHLSALPGGTSEDDPGLSRRVNLDAALAFMETLATGPQRPRFLFASSIAVFGAPLPPSVDDDTIACPSITYGAHKLMVETALADMVRRGDLDALALRLPGIVARPANPSGLRSAFMSDLFHRLQSGRPIDVPVRGQGQVWISSITRCIDNLVVAATADWTAAGGRTAITMPALHVGVAQLATTIANQAGVSPDLIRFVPDRALERQFAAYPPLTTLAAEAMGLRSDGDLAALVARTLSDIDCA